MILGFSSGCLYRTHDRIAKSTFDIFRKVGCNTIEIMCPDVINTERLTEVSPDDLKGFEHISLHAPSLEGMDRKEQERMLQCIEAAHHRIGFKYVVFHPDGIDDWEIFSRFHIPLAIENMDSRKKSCKDVEDLKKVFDQVDAKMVLDVNHCFSNDPTMKLASDFVEAFRDRIVEIHLSGFETFHELLYKTRQQEMFDSIFDKKLPIIIESVCDTIEDVEREYAYIKSTL